MGILPHSLHKGIILHQTWSHSSNFSLPKLHKFSQCHQTWSPFIS